tara:strand:- start:224 stop:1588 length:1365 start_codon:yes stop_codon:yes gene_type:complete
MRVRIVEKAKKTVGDEIKSQKQKGKKHDQAVAIALSKKERGEIISESASIDKNYLKDQGITLLKELGSGMFGVVYEIIADVGDGNKRYALKFVSNQSKGYAREKSNYQNIKQFVELSNIRQDAEAIRLGKILPIIYSVSEYGGGLYIIMEKLIPLSESEKKLFMSEISGLAYFYSQKGQKSSGERLIDYIIDRDGNIGISFGNERAVAIVKAIIRAPEYSHLENNLQAAVNMVMGGGKDIDYTTVMRTWASDSAVDDLKHDAIDELYNQNKEFKKFFQGISKLLLSQYKGDTPDDKFTTNSDFVGMLMDALFDIIFAQKYPMKYTKNPEYETAYETGYGQSSSIYDIDVTPNPKIKEQKRRYEPVNIKRNPAVKGKNKKMEPQKYPFDAIISTIRRLGRDWNIQAKDMHNANVMKRADGQFVIADIGLFNTKILQSMKSGIFESKKRTIRVKII